MIEGAETCGFLPFFGTPAGFAWQVRCFATCNRLECQAIASQINRIELR
ncbi:hypothetical protein CEV31_1372 [Brucella thiophenivorans]|uniref:Uncharacterized protein n=1 Tax=Brucella thiophenivorans TaxID=571255 RepID=A0A256FYN9_9HYPH|nr:hypothetical protein CEV31_1372 [Brucella thiophenivorans]